MTIRRYRKKATVVEAILYTGSNWDEIKQFVGNSFTNIDYLPNLKGCEKVIKGDYIVKGDGKEFYVCTDSLFLRTHDLIEEKPDQSEREKLIVHLEGFANSLKMKTMDSQAVYGSMLVILESANYLKLKEGHYVKEVVK